MYTFLFFRPRFVAHALTFHDCFAWITYGEMASELRGGLIMNIEICRSSVSGNVTVGGCCFPTYNSSSDYQKIIKKLVNRESDQVRGLPADFLVD